MTEKDRELNALVMRSVGISVYDGERLMCQCHTAEDAALIVEAMETHEAAGYVLDEEEVAHLDTLRLLSERDASLAAVRELARAMPHEPRCRADEEPCGAAAESGCEWPTIGCHTHSACTCHRGKILAAAGGAE